MKNKCTSIFVAFIASMMMGGLYAKTVAWYHFNEGTNGTKPASSGTEVFENAADPGSLKGIAYAMNANSLATNTNEGFRPAYTNDAPDCNTWRWHDPATGARGEDVRCLYVKSSNNDGSGQAGVVFVNDDVKLHCPNITVEFMVKLQPGKTLKNWAHMLVMRNQEMSAMTNNVKAWGLMINPDGKVSAQMQTRNAERTGLDPSKSISSGFASASPSVVDGKWHHIALTYDGAYARLYVDYVQQASKAWTKPIDYNENCAGRLCICGNDTSTYGRWHGFIDEVRISDEALPPSKFLHPGALPDKAAKVTDQDTAIYLPFDSAAVCDNTFFGTVGAPIVFNETVASNALFVGAVRSTDGILPSAETVEVVTNTIHSGLFATNSAVNDGCWKFGENTTAVGKSVHLTVDDYSMNGNTHLISSGDFTIEFWINALSSRLGKSCYLIAEMSKSAASNPKGQPGTLLIYLTDGGSLKCRLVSEAALAEYQTGVDLEAEGKYNDALATGVCDGQWHHVALSVDRTRRTASFYVDHLLVKQHTDFVLASMVANSADYKPLEISGGWGPNRQDEFHNLLIDELRITRRALSPQEFLTRGENSTAALSPTRAWMDFEGDLSVKPRPNELLARTASDAVVYSEKVPGLRIIDGNGDIIRESNTNSLQFSSSCKIRVLFERNILLERDMASQTIEFFMKGTNGSAKAWVYFARLYSNSTGTDADGERLWSIGYSNNAGDLYVNADTATGNNQVKYFNGTNLDDGRWHHIAVTLEPDGNGNTTVKAYKDYVQCGGAQTMTGTLQLESNIPHSCLAVGHTAFDGWIDEMRITQGILPVSQMLHVQKRGSMFLLR